MRDRVVVNALPHATPLEFFARLASFPAPVLLESASGDTARGRYSYIMADPIVTLTASAAEWPSVRDQVRRTFRHDIPARPDLPPFQGGWAGWFGYELGAAFDAMPRAAHDDLHLPDLALALYDWVIACDHESGKCRLLSTGLDALGDRYEHRARNRSMVVMAELATATPGRVVMPAVAKHRAAVPVDAFASAPPDLTGDFTAGEYQSAVATVIEQILDGELFQANLSQRFVAPFSGSPVALYQAMCERTQAPMAALIQQDDLWIISASPEQFLRYEAPSRDASTHPIKGTRPRSLDAAEDAELAAELLGSEKDRAENVMIVDLLRNDFARVCVPGSVQVPALCELQSFRTVHHLVSTVTGTLSPGLDALDLIAATFPGGSITGAPKLRAMTLLSELERSTRGVYCGAIGWIGLDGSMDTSIAIRTVTCRDGVAILNAGGGITARSNPEAEYQETLDKARALVAALATAQ